jgi:type I restriction enzyme S subunit
MPTYTCSKCARVFKQKSGYTDHIEKKNDCAQNTILSAVIETKVNEAIRAIQHKPEITKETLPAFFEDLHNLLWNKAGLSPERALEHMTFFFAYRLIEQQADTLGLPQECRWTFLASHKNDNDTYETMKKGCVSFQKNKITKPFFKKPEIDKADIVYEIVQQINRISLTILQETDTLGDIFEYMLGRGMSTMSDEGQYFTNRSICKLAFKLAYDIKKNLRKADGSLCTFADWFCGTGGFPAEFVKGVKEKLGDDVDWKKDSGSIYCQDMNLSSVTTTLLNMLILTGIPFSGDKIRGSNSFSEPITTGAGAPFNDLTIDYCFMNPPYGGDKSKAKEYKFAYAKKVKADDGSTSKKYFVNQEIQSIGIEDDDKVSAGVQLAMATLSADGGVCSIVLPQGFFFGASKKCVELRKKIAEEYKIWYVVDIASGAFANTGTKTSMMVFQKGVGPTEKVAFVGLDEKPLVDASLADLRSKGYSLNYKQYLPQSAVEIEGFEMVKLGDICDFYGGQAIKKEDRSENGNIPYYGSNGIVGFMDTHIFNGKYLITGQDGTLGTFYNVEGKFWASNHTHVFRPKNTNQVLLNYLFYYLSNNFDAEKVRTGSCIPKITLSNIKDVQIPLPSLERQQQIVEAIDGWAGLAQQEEIALKILEKQMMFHVKEMGRGQARVKLGEVSEIRNGKALTKEDLTGGDIPVIGGGVSPMGYHNTYNKEPYTVVLAQVGSAGNVSRYSVKSWITNNGMTIHPKGDSIINDDVLYYLLKNIQDDIKGFAEGTAQPKLSSSSVLSLEVQVPPLTEQRTLQSDFDEIRHKHAKIAVYKAKAQEAIQRLIPT